ncbi:Rrf2 family transcriptional regulator [Streptosporangium sp. NPDC048865]|uniref:RrF2 family transcriptional regulator n=1 Tax=Streptosporangium sp. NPDC048865 TaxID=3155766 RepID=UPI0034312053
MHITARSDYAIRAMLVIALSDPVPVKSEAMAQTQEIPASFLRGILTDLRRADLVFAQRGHEGGFTLTRPPVDISVGDVLRAVAGELTSVRGLPTGDVAYFGEAVRLRTVWLNIETSVNAIVDTVSLAALLSPVAETGRRRRA